MDYRLNPDMLNEIFAVPAVVADEHIRLAGSAQLKVLIWLLRNGSGNFNAEKCSKSIGLTPADCRDALQYWVETDLLITTEAQDEKKTTKKDPEDNKKAVKHVLAASRPRPVKPTMKEVINRQKESEEFTYLLDTASARLGRPISNGDMETLLYLYDTAGLPVEVILMVIEYAIACGKSHMRYIEKVALDWSDREINTISAAEQYLCKLERRRQAWQKLSELLNINQSPTVAQSDAAERWICDWQIDGGLLRLAYEKCIKATGRFNSSYMMKIIENWRSQGIDSVEKVEDTKSGKSKKPKKETSYDLEEYENMVRNFTPVYIKNK